MNKCITCKEEVDPIHHYIFFNDQYICTTCLWLKENSIIYQYLKSKDALRAHDIYDEA